MPPRPALPSQSALTRCFTNLRVTSTRHHLAAFSTTPTPHKREHRSSEGLATSEKRRLDNLALQERLKQERLSNAVNPVTGRTTPFVKSLETPSPLLPPVDWALTHNIDPTKGHDDPLHMNFYLTPKDMEIAIENSKRLTAPANPVSASGVVDSYIWPEKLEAHQKEHDHAVAAIQRIVSLSIGSNADRQRVNTMRCIETFGRHNTDATLPRDPDARPLEESRKTPRAGPDTGSSEVQAAILTVKIRNLAKMLEKSGNKDKHNKRNLRLLVHRRQKLLKYLKRKEKGGVRYRNVMSALGLDEAAVMKELSI
ncbi:uncharacterized protein H6S33_006498 [Morchella sextelata]|uniref:uncharacterized protein n=1 Tax=Morchella sextelata TaxID=1174677 RepID=UPI001D0422D1|nr:uncharacterized protein H6S33_006498 [Morchella sextelata]KAH0604830.1 hypothetical protein H6S33_006498 [Morchella sextelata]